MNFYDKKATPFLPMSKILELLRVSVWTGSLEVIDYTRKPNRYYFCFVSVLIGYN